MQLTKEISILWTSLAVGSALPLHSQERHWMAASADLILVGHFQTASVKRKGADWYFQGVITPKEVLFGPSLEGQKLRYQWVCSCCRPSPDLDLLTKKDGIWFFYKAAHGYWTSAAQTCSDPGYRPIEERADMLEYLRRYRRPSH